MSKIQVVTKNNWTATLSLFEKIDDECTASNICANEVKAVHQRVYDFQNKTNKVFTVKKLENDNLYIKRIK